MPPMHCLSLCSAVVNKKSNHSEHRDAQRKHKSFSSRNLLSSTARYFKTNHLWPLKKEHYLL